MGHETGPPVHFSGKKDILFDDEGWEDLEVAKQDDDNEEGWSDKTTCTITISPIPQLHPTVTTAPKYNKPGSMRPLTAAHQKMKWVMNFAKTIGYRASTSVALPFMDTNGTGYRLAS